MVKFEPITHTYTNDLGEEYKSVTTILSEQGLSPDYSKISKQVLNNAADRGTQTHKDLEDYIKTGAINNVPLINSFKEFCNNEKVDPNFMVSEEMVYNDKYKIAGTIDFQWITPKGAFIGDFKTTSQIHYESVTYQISLYAYLKAQGDMFEYYNYNAKVFHITGNNIKIEDITLIDFFEIENLLEANLNGLRYVPTAVTILNTSATAYYDELLSDLDRTNDHLEKLKKCKTNFEKKYILDKIKDIPARATNIGEHKIVYRKESVIKRLNKKRIEDYCAEHGIDSEQFYDETPTEARCDIRRIQQLHNEDDVVIDFEET